MTALVCPACGTPTVPAARFCFQCGTPLDAATALAEGDPRADRRIVTVLFGDLSDFTAWAEDLDPERVKVVTDRLLHALAQAVHDYGGHVDKLTGDGIMAVFGAPTAHEDDPERAVRAAVRMQDAVRRLVAEEAGGGRQLGLRVGLNTGEVLAGVQAALAYTVVGDTVNTASRLSDAAGVGAVLAGRETALATLPVASWRALPPLRLKGKRASVAGYELVDLRARPSTRLDVGDAAPLVGREAEFGSLVSRLLDAVDRQRPGSVLVTGDAGVGKTRLVRELSRFAAELPGSRMLWGRCTPYGDARDLAPLAEIVRTACGIDEGDPPEAARERVRRTVARIDRPVGGAWAHGLLTDRLLAVLGLAEPSEDESIGRLATATPGEPSSESEAVAGVAALVRALAAQGPLLLVLDDLQWAGPALLDGFARITGELTGPVLLVLLARADGLTAEQREWTDRLPGCVGLRLEPLEAAAAERLLRAYLGGSELQPETRQALLERAQGNPFFLAELLHLLVDRGLLRREAAGWRPAGELPPGVLPAGVHAVLAARIDGLDPGPKAALRNAAVIGATFWPAALTALGGTDAGDVEAHLAALVDRDIVRAADDGSYEFGHMLTQEVAYAGIPKAERARRHAALAAWATGSLEPPSVDVDALVAHHAERAALLAAEMGLPDDDPARAAGATGIAALLRRAEAALARDDHRAAVDAYARALRLFGLPGTPAAPDPAVRVGHAQALSAMHRLDEAEAELRPVAEAADAGDPVVRARALAVLGDVRRKRGDERGAVEALVRALATASDAGGDRVAGEAIRSLGLIDFFGGRLRDAERRFRDALDLAERVGDQRGVGWALQHLAWSATTRGDYELADATLHRALEVFGSFGDDGGMAWTLGTEALVRLLQGRLGEARALAGKLLPITAESGDEWGTAACLTIDAMAAAELGEIRLADERAAEAERRYVAIGDTWGRTMALTARGSAARQAGRHEAAASCLGAAVALAEQAHQLNSLSVALLLLGWTHYDAHQVDRAEAAAQRALRLAREVGLEPHAEIGPRVLLALVHRVRGDHGAALRILAGIAASPERPTLLFPMRQALAHYAGTLVHVGEPNRALEVAERAIHTPGEDVRSRVISLRAYGTALAACGRREDAERVMREALAAATATEQALDRPATERALADLLAAR